MASFCQIGADVVAYGGPSPSTSRARPQTAPVRPRKPLVAAAPLHAFSPSTATWRELRAEAGEAPAPRSDHACCALNDASMLVLGGTGPRHEKLADAWRLRLRRTEVRREMRMELRLDAWSPARVARELAALRAAAAEAGAAAGAAAAAKGGAKAAAPAKGKDGGGGGAPTRLKDALVTERVRRALSAALSLPAECFDVDADLPVEPTAADAIEACFAAADANSSGTIEGKELPRVLATLGLSDKKKAVKEALAKYDDDGDKKLDLAEFTGLIEDIQKTDALISEQATLAARNSAQFVGAIISAIIQRNYSAHAPR